MKPKFSEVCETVIKYKESSNKLVKKTVIGEFFIFFKKKS